MKPIEKISFEFQVTFKIREMIRRGIFLRGQKIKEIDLCEELGVSRTPVREALRVLSSEGLIDLVPNKGAFVSEPPIEKIAEMFDVMALLEAEATKSAVTKMVGWEFDKLKRLQGELEKNYAKKDVEGYLQANFRFHGYIQELSGNETLSNVIDSLREKIMLFRDRQLHQGSRFDESMQEHRELMGCFYKKDSMAAYKVMKEHILKQKSALVGMYQVTINNDR